MRTHQISSSNLFLFGHSSCKGHQNTQRAMMGPQAGLTPCPRHSRPGREQQKFHPALLPSFPNRISPAPRPSCSGIHMTKSRNTCSGQLGFDSPTPDVPLEKKKKAFVGSSSACPSSPSFPPAQTGWSSCGRMDGESLESLCSWGTDGENPQTLLPSALSPLQQ